MSEDIWEPDWSKFEPDFGLPPTDVEIEQYNKEAAELEIFLNIQGGLPIWRVRKTSPFLNDMPKLDMFEIRATVFIEYKHLQAFMMVARNLVEDREFVRGYIMRQAAREFAHAILYPDEMPGWKDGRPDKRWE